MSDYYIALIQEISTPFVIFCSGSFVGILVKYLLDSNLKTRELLFASRRKAYAKLMGGLLNHFYELSSLKGHAKKLARFHEIFSDVYLLGSNRLIKKIEKYKTAILALHSTMVDNYLNQQDSKNDLTAQNQIGKCSTLVDDIHGALRDDLFF